MFSGCFRLISSALAVCGFSLSVHADIEIIAHRGASAEAPENTLSSAKAGWEQGADAVEIDLWLSKDGRILVFHDKDTGRFEKPKRSIKDLTSEDAAGIDVGSWKGAQFAGEKMPALSSLLATTPKGRRFVLELKDGPEMVPELVRELTAAARPAEETCLISFQLETLRAAKKALPKLKTYYLQSWKEGGEGSASEQMAKLITLCEKERFDGLNVSSKWPVTPQDGVCVRRAGLDLMVWTVNDAETARKWIGAGVDAITTDKPGEMRKALQGDLRRLSKTNPAEGKIRVATFNILGARNVDEKKDLGRILDVLRGLNADVTAIQEVDKGTWRIDRRDIPEELKAGTGQDVIFGQAMPYSGGSYGCAVLSRLPVISSRSHLLKPQGTGETRVGVDLVCALSLAENAPQIRVIGTHLDHQNHHKNRLAQLTELDARIGGQPALPSVLAGDFNAMPGSEPFTFLKTKGWSEPGGEHPAPPTWPSSTPGRAIDHILTKGNWRITRIAAGKDIFPGDEGWAELLKYASDHVPLIVELELLPTP